MKTTPSDHAVHADVSINADDGVISVAFGERVNSTNAEGFRDEVFHFLESDALRCTHPTGIVLNLARTRQVDSIGLNLVFDLVRWSGHFGLPLSARIGHRLVYLTFLNVRLDRKLDLCFLPAAPEGREG